MNNLKRMKVIIFIITDMMLVNFSYVVSYYLRFNFSFPGRELEVYKRNALIITLVYIATFFLFKFYKSLWNYAGMDEFMLTIVACILASIECSLIFLKLNSILPLSIRIMAAGISIIFILGFRMSFRIARRYHTFFKRRKYRNAKNVMIIGAGQAATMVIKEMQRCKALNYKPRVMIDDDRNKHGTYVAGVKVMGNRTRIIPLAIRYKIDEILIAISSIDEKNKKALFDICIETGCKVKLIPGIYEIIDGKITLNNIRDVNIEDLLEREPVKLNMEFINDYIRSKIVIVTGGGGSIGSELCRQIVKYNPKQLIILENYENSAYDLQQEFRRKGIKIDIRFIIASIRDKKRINYIFNEYRPEIVFHTAAHKHAPLMEENPVEAIKNNIFGTLNLAECADKYGVEKFVMISTDKAANPTNIMGATKKVCEMIVQSMSYKSRTKFLAVRFGNLLGSNGSIVPLFLKQIREGGPIAVAHRDVYKFFMSIPEAAQLVLQTPTLAKGGEVFALDMGEPVNIYDLACKIIKLSGMEPNKDIAIEFVGLQPGEKLYEELSTSEEGLRKTSNKQIFICKPTFYIFELLKKQLDEIQKVVEKENEEDNKEVIIKMLEELVPTYKRYNMREEEKVLEIQYNNILAK
ncbi:MAG TPA: nucleoside-diphosphate sugar epimerase/dehydratase [Ruminiclostridium sp.]